MAYIIASYLMNPTVLFHHTMQKLHHGINMD